MLTVSVHEDRVEDFNVLRQLLLIELILENNLHSPNVSAYPHNSLEHKHFLSLIARAYARAQDKLAHQPCANPVSSTSRPNAPRHHLTAMVPQASSAPLAAFGLRAPGLQVSGFGMELGLWGLCLLT